jgi:hypothetical protein
MSYDSSGNGFHYSREERLRMGGREPEERKPGGIFRNRTLLIILLDVIFIFIIFGAANLLFPIFGSRTTIDGNLFRLRGVEVEESILFTLMVERQTSEPPEGESIFQVRFSLESEEGRREEVSDWISDVAPTAPEERRVVRYEAPVGQDSAWETAVATVRLGDEELRLATRIIGE